MTHEEYQNNIEKIASHYGYELQSRQLIEEMAELTVAINKAWRKRYYDFDERTKSYNNIIEEIADIEIMLEQLKYLMSCHDEVEQEKARKIERQLERMKGEADYVIDLFAEIEGGYQGTENTSRKTERSMIHPQYANRFIRQYLIEQPE